jgi:integrase
MTTVYWDKKILKDGSTRYYLRSKVRDVRRSHGSCRTLREAQTLKGEILKSVADGSYWAKPEKQVSLNEYYQQWVNAKAKTWKPDTLYDYKSTFRLHILPSLGDKKLADITPRDVQACIDLIDGKPATADNTFRYLRNLLNNAVAKEVIDRTPCRGIIVPKGSKETELDILSLKEVRLLCETADESLATLIAVLAYSGLRIGEALGLKWRDVDFDVHCIRVERTWTKHNAWSTPKSRRSRRAVPMTPRLETILHDAYNESGFPSPETVIFSGDGERPYDHSNVRRKFNKALNSAGLRHVRIHDLRHTFSTNMLACGCSIKALQNALGHSSAQLTLDTYAHYIPESASEAIIRFDALLSGSVASLSDQKKK